MSDLHIFNQNDDGIKILREKLALLASRLGDLLSEDDQLVCCILGDIIDKGCTTAFPFALELLKGFRDELEKIVGGGNVQYTIVPGNHDICTKQEPVTFSEFNSFATELIGGEISFSDKNSIHIDSIFGYEFIGINSTLNGNTEYGDIQYDLLNQIKPSQKSIVLVHHALISGDKNDSAAIHSGYELQSFLEKNSIVAMLHGHTHGCKRYTVGHNCQVVGVGPLFKEVPDVSNQCNIISITGGFVKEIDTLTFHADRKEWDIIKTFKKQDTNDYFEKSINEVYRRVLDDAVDYGPMSNLRIQVKEKYEDLEKEIESTFQQALVEAKAWQSESVPDHLNYTHVQLMNYEQNHWAKFAVKTLRNNPTNKRTIFPLIEKQRVYYAGDDELVSFDTVQLGFENDSCQNLFITVYLRALELRYFLPINLCETYLGSAEKGISVLF